MPSVSPKNYYCVYWYPTIFHQEKEHRYIESHPIDVSDRSLNRLQYLTIEEEEDSENKGAYHLHYYLSGDKKSLSELKNDKNCISFVFRYIRHSRNGFVVYSYDRDALVNSYWSQFDEKQARNIKEQLFSLLEKQKIQAPSDYEIENYPVDRILLSCYHHSKNFYHEHEVQKEADGKLEAFFFTIDEKNGKRQYLTSDPKLFPKNHDAINWFIDQFEKQFVRYAKRVSETYKYYSGQLILFDDLAYKLPIIVNSQDKKKIDGLLVFLRWMREISKLKNVINSEEYRRFTEANLKELQETDIALEKDEIRELSEFIPNFRNNLLYYRLKILETICGNATTEYTYCKTLIGSKYNEKYDYLSVISEDDIRKLIDYYEKKGQCDKELLSRDKCRKKAFNIRNCMRYIEGIRQKCAVWENELSQELIKRVEETSKTVELISKSNQDILKASQKSNRISELLGWLSAMLGCFGLGFALANFSWESITSQYKLWIPVVCGFVLFAFGLVKVLLEARDDSK